MIPLCDRTSRKLVTKIKITLVLIQRKTMQNKTKQNPSLVSLNDRLGPSGEKQQAVLLAFVRGRLRV